MTEPLQNDDAARAIDIVRRLEESGALGAGGRLPALLRYLVLEELAGRGGRLKAYAIATEVLGRNQAFDPAQDSIVRVEVARLRRALDYYYATSGQSDSLKITIPRGGYRPLIGQEVGLPLPEEEPEGSEATRRRQDQRSRRWFTGIAAFSMVLVAALALWFGTRWNGEGMPPLPRPAYSASTPRLVILPIVAADDAAKAMVPGLRAQIAALLSQQAWLAVSVEDNFIPVGALPPKLFSLSMVLSREDDAFTLRALLNAEPERKVVWNGRYASPLLHSSALDIVGGIAADIGRDLGYPLGPVGQAVAAKSGETAPEVEDRFLCMMNAYRYWRGLEPKQRSDALACLDRLTQRYPDFSEGRAMLALFALENARLPGGTTRALSLTKAEALLRGAPANDRLSAIARMTLSACKGDSAATRRDAQIVLALAPNDPDTLAEVANAAGMGALDWTLALTAEDRAFELAAVPHARYAHARAAKLLLDGKYEAALAAISRAPQTNLTDGQMMMLALATLADAPLRAQSAEDMLAVGFSRRPEDLFERIESACWHKDVKRAYSEALGTALQHRNQP